MTENIENNGCSQRDSAEHEGYAKASRSFNRIWKERDSAQPKLLEAILYKDNFNRAYKRVKENKGAPGIDGMTIEEALPYLKEHQRELTNYIYRGKYTPSPVRRLYKDNFNRAYKRVKENKGAPGIDGMTIEEALPYLKEHQRELTNYIYRGKYTPSPVRRSSRMSLWKKRTCGNFYSLSACFCLWK